MLEVGGKSLIVWHLERLRAAGLPATVDYLLAYRGMLPTVGAADASDREAQAALRDEAKVVLIPGLAFGEGGRHYVAIEALLVDVGAALGPQAAVLVKGSRFMQMERVVRSFEDSTAEA